MEKVCFKCHVAQPIDNFYRHPQMADGRLGKCKECTKRDVRERYALTRPERSEYERQRNQEPERRAKTREYMKRARERHPDRFAARTAVSNAVRDGRLKKQPCQHCGDPKSQAHHHDYSKPLDVEWLCFKCHREHAHGQVVVSDLGQSKEMAS